MVIILTAIAPILYSIYFETKKPKATAEHSAYCLRLCRKEATRTPDPYVPNVVRYQLRYFPIAVQKYAIIFYLASLCTFFYCWKNPLSMRRAFVEGVADTALTLTGSHTSMAPVPRCAQA